MKILLFGKNGQVGWELQRSLAPLGDIVAPDSSACNFTNPDTIADTIRALSPDVIVNAAAYTAVDKAESEPDKAMLVNGHTPALIAQEAGKLGAWLVHYSTDYVFDGSGDTPWRETDTPAPLNVYGQTKLEGEQAIQSSGCRHLIFRTSWIYGTHGTNFAKTILNLAKTRDTLSIVDDQIGAPTSAGFIADATAQALGILRAHPDSGGLYHLASQGAVSWYDYARFIIDRAQQTGIKLKLKTEAVTPIPSSNYPTPAKRPLNSRLAISKAQRAFGVSAPLWSHDVAQLVATQKD